VNNLHCDILVKFIVPILIKFGISKVNYIEAGTLSKVETVMINALCFTGVYPMNTSTWTYVRVVSLMNFYFTVPHAFLMFHQSAPHVVEEVFSYGPYFLLIVSSKMPFLFLMVYRYI